MIQKTLEAARVTAERARQSASVEKREEEEGKEKDFDS